MWCGNRKFEIISCNKEVAMQGKVSFFAGHYGFINPSPEDKPTDLEEGKGIHFNEDSLDQEMTLREKRVLVQSGSDVQYDLEESDGQGRYHAVNVRAVAV